MEIISFVIPVYRNEGSLLLTYQKIVSLFSDILTDFQYEFIFVDDGSDDNSLNELIKIRKQDKNVKILSFTRNFGQMAAMLAGFKQATGNAIINISADLQDPIELIPTMVEHWKNKNELVVCYRQDREDNFSARLFSKVAYKFLRMAIPKIPKGGFDYTLIDRKLMDQFNMIDIRNRFFQGDLLWFGYQTQFIPYKRLKRTIGKSQYRFWSRVKNFVDAYVDASHLPIRTISTLGFLTALSGFLYGLSVIHAAFFHAVPFTGWAPIIILILVIGGLIMIMLGIIGEYIWRIFDEVRKKPNYVIRETYE